MHYVKQISSVVVVAAVVAVCAWQWRHHDEAATAQPAALARTADAVAEGHASAAADSAGKDASKWARRREATRASRDLGTVVRAYKEANDCLLYHSARHEVDALLEGKQWNSLSSETLATLEAMDASASTVLSTVKTLDAFCSGSDPQALAEASSAAVFDAAVRGNPDAEVCFVMSGISASDGSESASFVKSLVDRYVAYAPVFSQKALERGDPRVAVRALARYAASPAVHPSWRDGVPKADPVLTWRGARLASLRSLPEQRERIEYNLAELRKLGVLSPTQIAQADAWAAATFTREFSGQAPINVDAAEQCYSSPGLAP
ncbi:hypothetical protein [Stenotrophomonas rhizophila]|uniref:hypothetical protein n=1 Tax=Stenotrophomonas rhizophila TaxID=216778 RepID=UPI00112F6D24|nr:hypothetical protein [Stenotrophomonas rhizophila]